MSEDNKPPIRWTSKGGHHSPGITFEGTQEAIDALDRCINGHAWFRFNGKEFETVPAHEQPPAIPDPLVEECWPVRQGDKQLGINYNVHTQKGFNGRDDPAIYVQHICCYSGVEVYEPKAKRLLQAGFEVLRSPRRGADSKFWEIWYLSGAWAAKGLIEKADTDEIVNWLCRVIGPGQIMVEGRRLGASID